MSSKIKIDFDEKALKDLVMKQARNAAQETSFEIECPHCQTPFSASPGLNTCPHCHNSVDLTLDIDF